MRISTTVDRSQLDRARELLGVSDSELIDRALAVLVKSITAQKEVETLREIPYESDPDLNWLAPQGPSLPYDGDVPHAVKELAKRRRVS